MSFGAAVQTCLIDKYAAFEGRATRAEYWWFGLFSSLVSGVVLFAATLTGNVGFTLVYIVISFGLMIPGLAVLVRRLHDTGRSGYYLWLGLIPLIGSIALLLFTLEPGMSGLNSYGAPEGYRPDPVVAALGSVQPGLNWCTEITCRMFRVSVAADVCTLCGNPTKSRAAEEQGAT